MSRFSMGPGAMVAAAFIGPGTVTTASAAGAGFGLNLLWAVAFSVFATLVLQELALRTALVTNSDLAPLIRQFGAGHWWGRPLLALVVIAIGLGNAAYQSGNLAGAGLGMAAVFQGPVWPWVAACALLAGGLIWVDQYRWLERALAGLVVVMALLFVGLAVLAAPALGSLPVHRLEPGLPAGALTLTLALIGTTVVPYNLFLHATAVRRRWHCVDVKAALAEARLESALSIMVGGVITAAVVVVAAGWLPESQTTGVIPALIAAVDQQLPGWGGLALSVGLLAAGLTSAIAAPVSAGWAVSGALGWPAEPRSRGVRWVAFAVLLVGIVFAVVAKRPAVLIVVAQAANAVLLPVIALVLIAVANQSRWLGAYRNGLATNWCVSVVLLLVLGLASTRLVTLILS